MPSHKYLCRGRSQAERPSAFWHRVTHCDSNFTKWKHDYQTTKVCETWGLQWKVPLVSQSVLVRRGLPFTGQFIESKSAYSSLWHLAASLPGVVDICLLFSPFSPSSFSGTNICQVGIAFGYILAKKQAKASSTFFGIKIHPIFFC